MGMCKIFTLRRRDNPDYIVPPEKRDEDIKSREKEAAIAVLKEEKSGNDAILLTKGERLSSDVPRRVF